MSANGSPSARGHHACPYCGSYDVGRLYLATSHIDSCECRTCSVRWDEDVTTGAFLGRVDASSARPSRPVVRPPSS